MKFLIVGPFRAHMEHLEEIYLESLSTDTGVNDFEMYSNYESIMA